jgi:hypothetical protein
MAIYVVDTEKELNGEFWTNRYLIEAASLEDANTTGSQIISREIEFHYNPVLFTRYRVRDNNPGTDLFQTVPINQQGAKGLNNSQVLPLFNTLRIDFPAGVGRPSRKYYRGCLTELDINGANLDFNGVGLTIENALDQFVLYPLVDPQGSDLQRGVLWPRVQMRQLRRGSKRRTTPVLPN